jgi:hypothetical protein
MLEKIDDMERPIQFYTVQSKYRRLKSLAITRGLTLKELFNRMIDEFLQLHESKDIVDKILAIPLEERLRLLHKLTDEEQKDAKD